MTTDNIYNTLAQNYASYPDSMAVIDIAKALQISRNTAYDLVRSDAIHGCKVAGQYRIPKSCFISYLAENMMSDSLSA